MHSSFSPQLHRSIVHVDGESALPPRNPSGCRHAIGGRPAQAGNPARSAAPRRRSARLSTTARRMQCAGAGGSSAPPSQRRTCSAPSAPIAISRPGSLRGTDRTVQIAAVALSSTAVQTASGWRGSRIRAANTKAPQHTIMNMAAALHSCRSRFDRCRTVQPMITQSRLKTRVPFVPPKPNEFFSATSIFIDRAVLAQ